MRGLYRYVVILCVLAAVCGGCAAREAAYVDADALYKRAIDLRLAGQHEAAARALGRFADEFRHDPKAHLAQFYAGEEHLAAGESDAALAAFRTLQREFPYSPFVSKANERCLAAGTKLLDAGDERGVDVLDNVIASARHSELAAAAHLALAEFHYRTARFADARLEYDELAVRFPTHAKAKYAAFRAALCEYRQIGRPARNLTHAVVALARFRRLRNERLGPEQVELVERYLRATAELAADHHLRSARSYLARGLLRPALSHLGEVVTSYPEAADRAGVASRLVEFVRDELHKEQ